ncbi:MAG: glycosyltransferase [Wenzhouxiangella sp.]|nr:MAG: glycosyltransferase [Wenzhouxiangella sp.]
MTRHSANSDDGQQCAPEYSIVVPTLDEGKNIDRLLERVFASLPDSDRMEVIIVDDNSRDETVARAKAWAADYPVRVIERQGPPDLSASVLAGARAAHGEWVAVMDADGSHPPERLPDLLAPLRAGSHDVSIGSRHAPGGRTSGWPWIRHLTSRTATLLAWPFTDVADPMAGFFATSRERLLALPAHAAGYKILLEILVQGGDRIRTTEVPITFEDRQHGQSKLGLKQQLTYLQRLSYLGGGRISLGSASKFGLVGLSGMLVDLLIFHFLLSSGARLGSAHVASFVVATLTNFALNYRWTFSGDAQADMKLSLRYLRFFTVAILALMMRGGVLVLLVQVFNLPPMLAIFPAIVVTAGVNYLGSAFYVFASTASGVIPRVRWHLAALGLFAYVLVLRMLYMGQVELIPDEMYYWMYSQHLALSYLDHPPLVGWLIAAGTALFGDTIFGVRAMLIPLSLMGAWYFYRYGATMGGRTAGLLCVLAVAVVPFFTVSGVLMTPDAPMIVAWVAALYYFKRALIDDEPTAFLGLGLAMGLGLLAKYTIALLAPAALLFMLIDPGARRWFFRPQPYLAVLLATLIFMPVLVWNWQHDWASFLFQGTRRLFENPDFASYLVIVYALLLLSPVLAVACFQAFGPVRQQLEPDQRRRRFMLIMTAFPLAVFFIYGLFTVIKFHWTLPAWIAMLPMVMVGLVRDIWPGQSALSRLHGRLMRLWIPSTLVLVILYGMLLHYFTLGLPGLRTADFDSGYLGWQETAQAVAQIEQEVAERTGRDPIVAGTSKWAVSAALAFHHPEGRHDHITAQNIIGMSGSMWEFWFDEDTDPGRPVILVNYSSKLIDEDWLELALIGLGPLEQARIMRDGEVIRTLYYRIAEGFRPEQLRTPSRIPE